MILCVTPPHPDELLYSWICRLAGENALSLPNFFEAYLGMEGNKKFQLTTDVRKEFPEFYKNLAFANDMSELYLALSTFGFEAIAMPRGQQTRYINNVFRPKDGLNPCVDMLFKDVRVCPACVKEDTERYGELYLHRSHQLSGVCMCHKHSVPLLKFVGKKGHELEFDGNYEETRSNLSTSDKQSYAEYTHALLAAGISSDSYIVKNAIFDRMAELSYGISDGYESFLEAFENWEHSDLWNGGDIVRFFKVKLITARYLAMEEIMPLLMFLYPRVNEAIGVLDSGEPLIEQYTCPDCGKIYCATPTSVSEGWGCPYCEADIPEQERFRNLVPATGHDMYEPLVPFESMDRKMTFLHKVCGNTIEIKPRSFLFEGVRCLCENTVAEEEARKAVEANPGFKLIKFTRTESPVTILHEECGRQFTCTYKKFVQFPGCRACNPPHMTTKIYRQRVRDLVGGEYTVVGKFVDQQTRIAIRHNKCGRVQEYLPSCFLEGQRCHECGKLPAWNESFRILKQYKAEFGSADIPKRDEYHGYSLGRWCQGQRDNYKKGRLSDAQIHQLEKIGFHWDPLEAEWERNYERYRLYTVQHGSPSIPRRTDFDGVHLGAWVETQRKREKEGKLSLERREKLLLINPNLFPSP